MQLNELYPTIHQRLDGSDERGRNRYRKTDLTRIVTERQILRVLRLQIVLWCAT